MVKVPSRPSFAFQDVRHCHVSSFHPSTTSLPSLFAPHAHIRTSLTEIVISDSDYREIGFYSLSLLFSFDVAIDDISDKLGSLERYKMSTFPRPSLVNHIDGKRHPLYDTGFE